MRIKSVHIGDHEMKILKVPDDNTVFSLRDINCYTRIQSILKSLEKPYSSKINFSKFQALLVGTFKKRIDKPG